MRVERDGDTVRITMTRPQRRNALSAEHLTELRDAFVDAGRTDATGIVLGAEGPVFSSGTSPMWRRATSPAFASY
jgi:enoyl-CoA hydratase/carnithine racemase